LPIKPVGGGIVYLESTQKLIILMRTVIFILALTALAAPALGAPKGPIACATPLVAATQNCNLCIEAASGGTATAQCYDCQAGYYLTAADDVTGSCTRCDAGKGIAAGGSTTTTTTRPTAKTAGDCIACHATCAHCLVPGDSASCARCAVGTFASAGTGPGYTCGTSCSAGTTRDVATTDLTGTETQNGVCVACHVSCSTCTGTGPTRCTKCAFDTYATAATTPAPGYTCGGTCAAGRTRSALAAGALSGTEQSTVCDADCHASCASCKGTAETGCTKCAIGRYATEFAAGTAKCSSTCDAGTTRDVAAAVLTDNEVKSTTCVACNVACAECKATPTACTKCAAGHFLSARTGTEVVGTCTACGDGKGKDADAAIFTGTSATTTKEDACKATCTAASNCGVCSAAKPDECLTCPTGKTLDAATKKCPATAGTGGSSASLVQALCGASLAAYALF
jgi:hypothetical protein